MVIVKWTDTQIENSGWMDYQSFENWCKQGLIICESAGFLIFENDDFIVIAQTVFEGDVSEAIKIPKAIIKTMERIDLRSKILRIGPITDLNKVCYDNQRT